MSFCHILLDPIAPSLVYHSFIVLVVSLIVCPLYQYCVAHQLTKETRYQLEQSGAVRSEWEPMLVLTEARSESPFT